MGLVTTTGGGSRRHKGKKLTAAKAKVMLEEGEAQGHALTGKQKRFFGWVAGGRKPRSRKR